MDNLVTRRFSFGYMFNGSQWSIELWASSPDEARLKFDQLKLDGKYEHEILGTVYGGLELELVETEHLIAEVLKRFDSAVFAGSSYEPIEKGSEDCISKEFRRYDGNARVCQGLACGIIDHINRRRIEAASASDIEQP